MSSSNKNSTFSHRNANIWFAILWLWIWLWLYLYLEPEQEGDEEGREVPAPGGQRQQQRYPSINYPPPPPLIRFIRDCITREYLFSCLSNCTTIWSHIHIFSTFLERDNFTFKRLGKAKIPVINSWALTFQDCRVILNNFSMQIQHVR